MFIFLYRYFFSVCIYITFLFGFTFCSVLASFFYTGPNFFTMFLILALIKLLTANFIFQNIPKPKQYLITFGDY